MVSRIYINVGIFEINASKVERYFDVTLIFIIRNYISFEVVILKNRQSTLEAYISVNNTRKCLSMAPFERKSNFDCGLL